MTGYRNKTCFVDCDEMGTNRDVTADHLKFICDFKYFLE